MGKKRATATKRHIHKTIDTTHIEENQTECLEICKRDGKNCEVATVDKNTNRNVTACCIIYVSTCRATATTIIDDGWYCLFDYSWKFCNSPRKQTFAVFRRLSPIRFSFYSGCAKVFIFLSIKQWLWCAHDPNPCCTFCWTLFLHINGLWSTVFNTCYCHLPYCCTWVIVTTFRGFWLCTNTTHIVCLFLMFVGREMLMRTRVGSFFKELFAYTTLFEKERKKESERELFFGTLKTELKFNTKKDKKVGKWIRKKGNKSRNIVYFYYTEPRLSHFYLEPMFLFCWFESFFFV